MKKFIMKCKKTLALSMSALLACGLTACGGSNTSTPETTATAAIADTTAAGQTTTAGEVADDGHPGDPSLPWTGELLLYIPFPQARKEQLVNGFQDKYGIKVTQVEGSTSELIARLESEKDNAQGDIMIGGMVTGTYQPNDHMFQEYTPANNENYPDEYKTVDGKYSVYSLEASIIAVNLELMEKHGFTLDQLDSYEDMLNPDLKGLLCMADPLAASSGYEHLVNMLVVMGDESDDFAEGWEYVDKLLDVATVLSSSNNASSGVAQGEFMVALSYESTMCSYMASGYDLAINYMEEGTIFGLNGAAIVKDCPNLRSAQLFIDFITSEDFQIPQAGSPTYTRSVIVEMPEDFPGADISTIQNVINQDPPYFTVNKGKVAEKYLQISQAK